MGFALQAFVFNPSTKANEAIADIQDPDNALLLVLNGNFKDVEDTKQRYTDHQLVQAYDKLQRIQTAMICSQDFKRELTFLSACSTASMKYMETNFIEISFGVRSNG